MARMGRMERKEARDFYILIFPWLIVFIFLGLYPLLYGLYLSFTNYMGFNIDHLKWIGMRNYRHVFTDSDAMYSLGRSFYVGSINVVVSTVVSFFIAVLLNQKFKGVGFFRALYYLPSILPITGIGLMWKYIFSTNGGLLNSFLELFGIHAVNWLGYDYATTSLFILLAWGCGGGIIIYLAGLKGIPNDLYEAAAIDGAGPLQRFRKVTVPLMTPVIFFNFVFAIIGSLQIFAQAQMLSPTASSGGLLSIPLRPNYLYLIHAFQQIFAFQRYGYGLAMLWVLFLLTIVLTLAVFGTSRYWVHYESNSER
ncbi:sugar ABC transporter permease [Paenibacillus lycopersici]|uniref:Sugar ABC transporter permease n=1 Tax=Paenibacillus lycopersici TaxID=2704462 RepID=A0A6C0FYY9_9BACL|nr:sugar ABC transporter permease [Paenibacillus lycopersici]QHT59430.1 sugar ABC transporter permease [Paenibacillus lycopersici]